MIISYLIIYIIVFVIIQNVYFSIVQKNGINKKMDDHIQFNLENKDSIENLIKTEIKTRLDMLKTINNKDDPTKLSYIDWIAYNNNDHFIEHPTQPEMKYWIQVWRCIPNTGFENFQLKVYADEDYIDHTWKDLLMYNSKQFISTHVDTDDKLIKKFFLADEKPNSVFRFYWFDPVFDKMVDRKSMVFKYDDGFGNTGTISSGYTIKNMTKDFTYNHYRSDEGKMLYYLGLISTIIIAIIIFYSNIKLNPKLGLIKAIIFFSILMSYMTYYFSLYDEHGTFDIEKMKFDGINQGILSMSFMTGISIFILTSMEKSHKDSLYNETSFLLVIVMFTIIASLFKNNSYVTPAEITSIRSIKEFFFNYCLFVNLFIIINFGLNVFF
jgi:hypothetical protein